MGLRCLLGHDFGEPEVEREREEEGEEMVVTVRDVKTCGRCGERQVVSENKEVTSIRTPDEVGLDDPEDAEPDAPESDLDDDFEPPADPEADDGVILDETATEADERGHGEWPDPDSNRPSDESPERTEPPTEHAAKENLGGADEVATVEEITADAPTAADDDAVVIDDAEPPTATPGTDDRREEEPAGRDEHDPAAVDDDAVIMTDDDDEAEEASGRTDLTPTPEEVDAQASWPDHDTPEDDDAAGDSRPGEPSAWPDHDGADEGFAAEPGDGTTADVSFGNGLTPEAPTASETEQTTEYVGVDPETRSEFSELVRADGERTTPNPSVETEFYCPNCGHSAPAGESSMRSGDICPACHRGYIAERER